jgi:hypothetical protein
MRKYRFAGFLFLLFSFYACKHNDKQTSAESENNIDAARNFIRAALDGKFSEARKFMLQDSVNTNHMDVHERSWQTLDRNKKDAYRTSTIQIHGVDVIDSATTIVIYSNSYMKDHDTLKVVKVNDLWLVDFKYIYPYNRDSSDNKPLQKDTIQ